MRQQESLADRPPDAASQKTAGLPDSAADLPADSKAGSETDCPATAAENASRMPGERTRSEPRRPPPADRTTEQETEQAAKTPEAVAEGLRFRPARKRPPLSA